MRCCYQGNTWVIGVDLGENVSLSRFLDVQDYLVIVERDSREIILFPVCVMLAAAEFHSVDAIEPMYSLGISG